MSPRIEPAFSICVYCGSRPGVDPAFAAVAAQVGHWIGRHGGQLVYGGGGGGLMGIVADAALAAGGRVVGVIPRQRCIEHQRAAYRKMDVYRIREVAQTEQIAIALEENRRAA